MEYLFAAYTLIWIAIFGYTLYMGKKQKDLSAEIAHLQKVVESQPSRR